MNGPRHAAAIAAELKGQLTRFGICLQDIIEAADLPPGSPGPIGLRKYTLNDRGDVRKVQSVLQESCDGDFIRRIENGRRQPASVRYSPSQSKTGKASRIRGQEVQLAGTDQIEEVGTG